MLWMSVVKLPSGPNSFCLTPSRALEKTTPDATEEVAVKEVGSRPAGEKKRCRDNQHTVLRRGESSETKGERQENINKFKYIDR